MRSFLRFVSVARSPIIALTLLVLWMAGIVGRGEGFSLLNYNVKGNNAADWSTNAAQVQAIGRQVRFLQPDVITFQEIPFPLSWQMTNFVTAFLPGYHLAGNSGTDGYIRSVILSRFPIRRSAKWLDGVSLTAFGHNSSFTRDLFEAEIDVPGLSQPLHVFTTHLKAGQDTASVARRGAEARAISNFFVTIFLPSHQHRPYVLTGDINEDVALPSTGSAQPFAALTASPTGLRMTRPVNPQTGSERTFSIQAASLTRRYDYVLPSALLATNVVSGQIFRTDLAPGEILPALRGDSVAASDHLPVLMVFADPYARPFPVTQIVRTGGGMELGWPTVPGGRYHIERTEDFDVWRPWATNLVATNWSFSFSTNWVSETGFYRVRIGP